MLERCLDSIPQRKDVQIIIIDDDSSPEIVDFVHFPGQNRTDVEVVFTKEEKGAGYARNCGLEKAEEGNGYYLQMLMISFYRVFGIRWIFTVILIMT